MSADQGRRDGGLVARRGLEDDQRGLQGAQAGHQLGEPGLTVGDDEGGPGGADWDVEMVLGDIETDEELVHDPSELCGFTVRPVERVPRLRTVL